jgi:hypothetical protein
VSDRGSTRSVPSRTAVELTGAALPRKRILDDRCCSEAVLGALARGQARVPPLSRLLNSRAGRQAARKQLELAGTGSLRGRLGLKGVGR